MPRKAKFSENEILDVARDLVVEVGPRDATLADISKATGAPVGSIYHRFKSKDVLLARIWLDAAETFFESYVQACERGPGAAARQVVEWSRSDRARACVLLVHPSDAFVGVSADSALRARLLAHRKQLQSVLQKNTKRWLGSNTAKHRDAVRLATVEIPMGAVRTRLANNETIPPHIGRWVEAAAESVIGQTKEKT